MHSKVDARVELDGAAEALGLAPPCARARRGRPRARAPWRVAGGARAWSIAARRPSCVIETSTSFCSCICSEQSRPPSETHHSPLPRIWISLWRVCSMLSSMQHVLVVADAGRLHLGEDLAHQAGHAARRRRRCAAPCRRRRRSPSGGSAGPGCSASRRSASMPDRLGQLVDREEIDVLRGTTPRAPARRAPARASVSSASPGTSSPCSCAQRAQRGAVGVLAQQRAHGGVVHAGRDRHVVLDRRALGLVLRAGRGLRVRARADEAQAGLLERAHEVRVLGHEAVAGEDVVVAVLAADAR